MVIPYLTAGYKGDDTAIFGCLSACYAVLPFFSLAVTRSVFLSVLSCFIMYSISIIGVTLMKKHRLFILLPVSWIIIEVIISLIKPSLNHNILADAVLLICLVFYFWMINRLKNIEG